MPLLLDTGIVYALADADDAWHERARAYLEDAGELLLVPVSVVPEAAYLLRARLGVRAERVFIESLARGEVAVEPLSSRDLTRAAELMSRYETIGFVDASVMAIAERLRLTVIATTDRRHFGQVRPAHAPAFELVP
jgi:predicted nucleic acid-binding protein